MISTELKDMLAKELETQFDSMDQIEISIVIRKTPKGSEGMKGLIDIMVTYFKLTLADLKRDKRDRHLADARAMIMHVLHYDFDYAYPTIGKMLNRDRTTVYHNIGKVDDLRQSGKMKEYDSFRAHVIQHLNNLKKVA